MKIVIQEDGVYTINGQKPRAYKKDQVVEVTILTSFEKQELDDSWVTERPMPDFTAQELRAMQYVLDHFHAEETATPSTLSALKKINRYF